MIHKPSEYNIYKKTYKTNKKNSYKLKLLGGIEKNKLMTEEWVSNSREYENMSSEKTHKIKGIV